MSGRVIILRGDAACLPLPDCSVDAVVTDPPYGLEFMGREWDTFKTGDGFRRSRNTADAGRDSVFGRASRTSPEYSTGKPSSARIRERVDQRTNPAEGKSVTRTPEAYVAGSPFQAWCEAWGRECLRVLKPGGHLLAFGGTRTYHRLACGLEDAGLEIRDSLHWIYGSGFPKSRNLSGDLEGWGTALKPSHEPVIVARKPLAGTVEANMLEHGTGALNVDGCRVRTGDSLARTRNTALGVMNDDGWQPRRQESAGHDAGRWPPNVLLSEEAAGELDRQTGILTSGANPSRRSSDKFRDAYGEFAGQAECTVRRGADSGGASRFFPVFRYEAKADASERPRLEDGTAWPTVKPVALMQWLVRLVTPPGGTVLDPFCGTGTTGQACAIEGFSAVLADKDPQALALTRVRLARPVQPALFGEAS